MIDKQDLIDYVYGFKFTYQDYQMENFVIDVGVTDSHKLRQAVIEIENRYKNYEDTKWTLREVETRLKIAERDRDNEKDELQKELHQIEVERHTATIRRTKARVKGLNDEIDRLWKFVEKCGVNNIDELDKILHDPENEKNYWITRLGKQSAIDMLSYGKISSGNMDSITNMPSEDQEKVIGGAIAFTKKMENGILTLQDEVVRKLENNVPKTLLPDVNEEIDQKHDAKNLLGATKPKTGL